MKKSIVIIEDEKDIVESLKYLLEKNEFEETELKGYIKKFHPLVEL